MSDGSKSIRRLKVWSRGLRVGGTALAVWGGLGWIAFAVLASGVVHLPGWVEVPMGELQAVGVASDGSIYCGIGDRIQMYDHSGRFVRGWPVPAAGGAFGMRVDGNDRIHIGTARSEMHLVFDRQGRLIEENRNPEYFFEIAGARAVDGNGCRYTLRSPHLFPGVVRIDPSRARRTVVGVRWYLWPLQAPLPALVLLWIGLGLAAVGKGLPDLFLIPEPRSAGSQGPQSAASMDRVR